MNDRYLSILQQYWGYTDFRGIQREIIESIGKGRDTLGLMPTGGGKSITFQVPALAQEGTCIIVTPLIALMKDQVSNLRYRGIKATAVYSGMTHNEIVAALENCILGGYKFLYVSPERLSSELFLTKLRHIRVSFITVDEAHCISQWGYDFRPSYLRIAEIRKSLPGVPVLAITATATPPVVKDIQKQLHFHEENVIRMSFERTNLSYVVRVAENKQEELVHILKSVAGSAIVYTRSRRGAKETADLLNENNITALHYHAGLSNAEKDIRQERWQAGEIRVMVATNAFGMGIDKPDVRLVIHIDLPDSIESYFQEAGRAGRDGLLAYTVLLYNQTDRAKLKRRIPETYPDKDFIRLIYEELSYYYQIAMGSGEGRVHEFDINDFCMRFKHFPVPVDSALQILSRTGYIQYTEAQENSSRLKFLVERDELYRIGDESPELENLIKAILRCYCGVFADYVNIEETNLAYVMYTITDEKSKAKANDTIYRNLKLLSQRRVIHYIPHRVTPFIVYNQRREEASLVPIPPEIYEDRREQYKKRIEAIIAYAENENVCRSRVLLRYFGEKDTHNCMRCDVCLKVHEPQIDSDGYEHLSDVIIKLLADGKPHLIRDLEISGVDEERLDIVMEYLIKEDVVRSVDGMLMLVSKDTKADIKHLQKRNLP
jgi:ATP-dependent DNA helicase RecQ